MRRNVYYFLVIIAFSLSLIIYLATPWTDDVTKAEDITDFNYPRPKETVKNHLAFLYYDADGKIHGGLDEAREVTLQENSLLSEAKSRASKTLPRGAVFHGGRYRWLADGVEHDLIYEVNMALKRVTLYQELRPPVVVRSLSIDSHKVVHIILALKGRLDKYATFLNQLLSAVLPHDRNLSLTVACFSDVDIVRDITSRLAENYPGFKYLIVPLGDGQGDAKFSRGRGLHEGALAATVHEDDLIFFCDVDVLIKPDFFRRCRANTVFGRQVYYPMVFSLYNPHLVYPIQDQPVPPIDQQLKIAEENGFFRQFGYGMLCVHRGDYLGTGGYMDLSVWGGEDEALFRLFLTSQHMKVIRAADPSLFHLYHGKVCEKTDDSNYIACIKSKAKTEGSQLHLGLTLLKLQQGTDLEGLLSKRFYYFWLVPYLGALLTASVLTNVLLALVLIVSMRRKSIGCKAI